MKRPAGNSLIPVIAVALAACPASRQETLLADVRPQADGIGCAARRMAALDYEIRDSSANLTPRFARASKLEGGLQTILTARLFVYPETQVRRLTVRAQQVSGGERTELPTAAEERQAQADARSVFAACTVPSTADAT